MGAHNLIKVVKRSERDRPEQSAAEPAESPARGSASGAAAVVREWISECRQGRVARHQEAMQLLGRQGHEVNASARPTLRDSRESGE